ncbi:hypothetical protein M413DRAFT_448227 [Hebeloma cylindrosporum]|uniref:Secreted protein n=1 Tax=Hebeloma cylindrosporum TaxID=76867 RepID=A0A0C3BLX2_HEBCY|nr:hypothetical protein M413DRAFT_448227 [Hebeloma cylindrosporum h7]
MKNFLRLVASAALLPSFALGLVGISWNIANAPANGFSFVTFPISIGGSPHRSGYYFAQQFNFIGQRDIGYIGLQPRPDSAGKPIIHVAFSSFIQGTTTGDNARCHSGADGGPGVSCSIEFSAPYGNGFKLEVQNPQGTMWVGTVIDTTTGERRQIGSWTLPAGTKGIVGSQMGFVEYYPWNSGTHTCSSLPKTSVVFGIPYSNVAGSLSDAYEYGDCVGKVGFQAGRTAGQGVQVIVGF